MISYTTYCILSIMYGDSTSYSYHVDDDSNNTGISSAHNGDDNDVYQNVHAFWHMCVAKVLFCQRLPVPSANSQLADAVLVATRAAVPAHVEAYN